MSVRMYHIWDYRVVVLDDVEQCEGNFVTLRTGAEDSIR